MTLRRILCSFVDPFNIVNELHITFDIAPSRAHVVLAGLLFGRHLFELLADACLHRFC